MQSGAHAGRELVAASASALSTTSSRIPACSAGKAVAALIAHRTGTQYRPCIVKLPKGHDQVLEILNQVLTNELTGINQYFLHSKICENWGYGRLASKIRLESIDEMKHADEVIDRILYLEGVPNLQRLGKVNCGENIPEMFKLDLDLEKGAIQFLNESIETVRGFGDHGTFDQLTKILVSEEQHADWLEAQLDQLDQMGVQNYLTTLVDAG